jgi:hypothetical protein
MRASRRVVWIDDNPEREGTAKSLPARFINVNGRDIAKAVEGLLGSSEPGLVVVDHILDKGTATNRLYQRGSTIAEAIKEKWPSCPVVGVTNASRVSEIDVRTRRAYDVLFPYLNFQKYKNRIAGMKRGFATIARTDTRDARAIVHLLKAPSDDEARLLAALPDELKKSSGDASAASQSYTWVQRLCARPGFLYDNLSAATHLGLNSVGFKKVGAYFVDAKYIGLFAQGDEPRWWVSRLTDLLYAKCKPGLDELPWHVGRRLPGLNAQHFSRCFKCREDFPETVAYLDAESDQREAMHFRCTLLHPKYKRELYFDDIRMMQPD